MALPEPQLPALLLPRADYQSLMIHRRKLVVRPINVSDWIFDIRVNQFLRHLIKVLKGSAAITGQSCPQPGLNRVLSSLWAAGSLLPICPSPSFAIFILHCSAAALTPGSGAGRPAGPAAGLPSLAARLSAQAPGTWPKSRAGRAGRHQPFLRAVSGHPSPSRSHSSFWGLGRGKGPRRTG